MEQLIKYGKVKRGMLGVLVQDVTPALVDAMHLPSAEGALISQVLPGSPAAFAGFKSKDVIISINNKPIRNASQVRNNVSLQRVGTRLPIKVWRSNKLIHLSAVIVAPEKLKATQQKAAKMLLAGLALRNFNQLVNNKQVSGVQVLYADDNSIAYGCGLRPGDIILSAANQQVTSLSELQKIAANHPQQLLLEIKRGMNGNLFLVLEE